MPFIVSIVGAPGTGKTFLSRRLSPFLDAVPITEPEPSTYPEFVKLELAAGVQTVESFKWFRGIALGMQNYAVELKKAGKWVILDTFWACNELYLDSFFDEAEKAKARKIADEDRHGLAWPDLVVYLRTSNEKIALLSKKRERAYESREIVEKYFEVNKSHEDFFSNSNDTLIVERDNLDFQKTSDLQEIAKKILDALNIEK